MGYVLWQLLQTFLGWCSAGSSADWSARKHWSLVQDAGHWSKMLVTSQMIRNIKDLMDSQVTRAPSCLAIQLNQKGIYLSGNHFDYEEPNGIICKQYACNKA